MPGSNLFNIAVSVALHATLVGVLFVFSGSSSTAEERVYRVVLAEFAAPVSATAITPAPALAPEPARPEPVKPEPRPDPVKPPEPKVQKISTKKKTEAATPKVAEETPRPQPQMEVAMHSGPSANIGGFMAYEAEAVDERPSISRRALPEYPRRAKRMNVQGRVEVRLVVDQAGEPKECEVVSADPEGYFEAAALDAARRTKFMPGKVKGRPVNTVVHIPFVFTLR